MRKPDRERGTWNRNDSTLNQVSPTTASRVAARFCVAVDGSEGTLGSEDADAKFVAGVRDLAALCTWASTAG